MDNWTFHYFQKRLDHIERLLVEITNKENTMAQNIADLQAAISAVDAKVDAIASQITDLASDFDAAVKKLQDDIASGTDLTSSVTALATLSDKLGATSDALSAIDLKAETVSGQPTPPPVA